MGSGRRVGMPRTAVAAAMTVVAALIGAAPAQAAPVEIDVLSNRADLISGGDALVAVERPAGREVTVTLGRRDVTDAFAERPDGTYSGLVTGIPNRAVRLRATLANGRGASIRIVGHPNGGPVFSGPQLDPWVCQETAVDEQCNQPAQYLFYARTQEGFEQIDPANPPDGIQTTTTDQGVTVPFIVRLEVGYQNRDQYKIATLYDPQQPWEPWAPQEAWNRKLVFTHGGSCGTDREAGSAPDVFRQAVLGRGYMVASTALNNLGHNCNPVLIAESEIMARERIVEEYGPVQRTIGTGCSGGSIAQLMTAHAYPGFYDGITVQCTFVDLLTTGKHAAAGHLFKHFFSVVSSGPGGVYTPADHGAVNGSPLAVLDDELFDAAFWSNITGETGCDGLPDEIKWSPSNLDGERCGVLDHNVNVIGLGESGYAGVPLDNEGVQFGLVPLLEGGLSPAKFVDINARIGGLDKTTYERVPQRTEADPEALRNAYRSGYMAIGNTLDQTPILEGRGSNEATAHVTYPSLAIRARLDRQFGNHDNHVLYQGPIPLVGGNDFADRMIFEMDRWIAGIQADERDVPKARKIRENRPGDVFDRCILVSGIEQPGTDCEAFNRFYLSPSNVAGESMRNDILKCRLKPLRRADYGFVRFTDEQWATLQETFPDGVCDWDKPGVGETETVPWLTYSKRAGGTRMGAPPRSRSFGKPRAVVKVRKARRALRRLADGRRQARVVLVKARDARVARRVKVRVLRGGRVVAKAGPATVTKRRTHVVVRRVRPVPAGRLRVRVTGVDEHGRTMPRTTRAVRVARG